MLRIITVRRICQVVFFLIFVWFCLAASLGEEWNRLRGWPVNWIIQLDPLVGLGTLLTTRTLYAGLIWGLATVVLTIFLGRFFCGWVCPFGAIHQFVGFLGRRRLKITAKIKANRFRKAQVIKYYILIFLLSAAAGDLIADLFRLPKSQSEIYLGLVIGSALAVLIGIMLKKTIAFRKVFGLFFVVMAVWTVLSLLFKLDGLTAAALQTGLLDPLPLVHRSINLVLLPLLDRPALLISANPRFYQGAWLIGAVFLTAVFLNLKIPRFYCRFICPLGALLGLLGRNALWRIGKTEVRCHKNCHMCETHCEGACEPSGRLRINECILCMNCLDGYCPRNLMTYQIYPSAAGEMSLPNMDRREFITAFVSGTVAVPMLRLTGGVGPNWNPVLIRPPGALDETEFLARCIKCGQCMRVCPTNVIQPALFEFGAEALWTPVLNFRIGTSGCQLNCIACGNLCPTAAIRPISLDERLGVKDYADTGALKIGTAFVDRSRCLPWVMDRPCLVCQENCPVSPKAIFTRTTFNPVRLPDVQNLHVKAADGVNIRFENAFLTPGAFATGDYFLSLMPDKNSVPRKIIQNTADSLTLDSAHPFKNPLAPGTEIMIQIRLLKPYVDPNQCIGCGVCEHECPVKGKRAIRVSAENESRNPKHTLLLRACLESQVLEKHAPPSVTALEKGA